MHINPTRPRRHRPSRYRTPSRPTIGPTAQRVAGAAGAPFPGPTAAAPPPTPGARRAAGSTPSVGRADPGPRRRGVWRGTPRPPRRRLVVYSPVRRAGHGGPAAGSAHAGRLPGAAA